MKVLITGGTNGMGKGVVKALAEYAGETNEIIILCRSEQLGHTTINELTMSNTSAALSLVVCDLADMKAVKAAVLEIRHKHDYLDAIFINAGLGYAAKQIETVDGMDSHFQVNYLSQFYFVVQLLELLEKSARGGRVIFNATPGGKIYWDDIQMIRKWSYENAIQQAMVAKRMFLIKMHALYQKQLAKVSFIGFSIHKTVWTNQLNIIPAYMRIIASIMKAFGTFISMETCGQVMLPLFMEDAVKTAEKSGGFFTWKNHHFEKIKEDSALATEQNQNKLLEYSLRRCKDDPTERILGKLEK